ncbi:peptidoglycan DD-metalloendopeptidase family protein [Hymenobacter arizonensis]|uniref:Septal ring factor EnvC, activator of murein hydrolases AmiA and AmiB n=1 Tax=Hymenobacter arizonensis TaxID=1227077 RepID=A0A1I5X134_HYMAR|nr:peptidoglycan DD-metalloendopeptidase family protein [Hymenobacter arizonensis]SFQ25591.1 Septal ring factor EnvC, activator of murein hydrolases AmiA and AmiB [Hymenobacter arizonensis]
MAVRARRQWWLLCLLSLWLALPAAAQQPKKKQPAKTKTPTKSTQVSPSKTKAKSAPTRRAAPKSKEQLERERLANLRQIQETSQALNQTQEKKKVSLGQLNVIKEKLTEKKQVIQGISTQLQGIESNVHQTAKQVLQTQQTLRELKAEYARLLYTASKTSNGFNRLMFLFASDSFNEFALRLRYIRQYTEERQRQAARIMGTQQQLSQQLTGLTQQQRRKSSLLNTQLNENKNLLTLKTKEDQMVQQLSQQEQGLRQELEERRRAVVQLDNLIAQRVREEIARAARAARLAARRQAEIAAAAAARRAAAARSAAGGGRTRSDNDDASAAPESDAPETAAETAADRRAVRIALTPESALLSSSFAGNRGRLPWPVSRGFISQRFGRHAHPVLKNVTVENRGVDIQTGAGESVRSCFDGKVLTIANIAGMNTIVMIQHGDFFTVYAKLRSVSVREGQRVSAKEVIGVVATDSEGTSEVQFQVWHNSQNLNPQSWLGHR